MIRRSTLGADDQASIAGPGCVTLAVPPGGRTTFCPADAHCSADGAPLTLLWAGPTLAGDVSHDGRALAFTAPAGFSGTVACPYALRGPDGSIATGMIDFIVQKAEGGEFGAWGPGPRSGDRWWTGFGDVTGNALKSVDRFEELRGRAVDIIAVFAPKGRIKDWDDLAGGEGDDETEIGGTLTMGVNNKKVIWDNPETRALPVHLNLTLVPPRSGNKRGGNPGVWWDYVKGEFDVYWRRLGKRMAYLDDTKGRSARLILDLGWEQSGEWYPWSISGQYEGAPTYTRFPLAFARIVEAIREGHRSYAGKDCPYKFCWRPSRQTVAPGVHHTAFYPGDEVVDLMGVSHHERDPYVTADNWSSRTKPWPKGDKFTRDGWDPYFDFCAQHGKHACFPEWSPIKDHTEYEPSPHPEEFVKLTRSYIEDHLPLFAYDCYFNGDESKITDSPDWEGTRAYVKLWGGTSG